MTVEQLLESIVAIPSVSRDERALAETLSTLLESRGAAVSRAGNNLWFEVGHGRPRLLLLSHLDTVPAGEDWTRDPHAGRWEDGRLVGLGASDAKGCVAAMADAALGLLESGAALDGTAVVAFTAEEEVGGGQIAALRREIGPIDAAVVGEPTSLDVCVAQRGLLVLRCVAHGRTAHAAHGELGLNAIHAAAADIARLAGMRLGSHPLLGETRAQVTQIGGGRARNQVPDRCEFFVDLRTSPGTTPDDVIRRLGTELASEIHVHSARYVPCATDETHPVVQAALAASGRTAGTGSRTASDWAFLSDLPAVKVGPGDTLRSHCPDEYLTRDELLAGASFYRQLIPDCLRRLTAWTMPGHTSREER